MSIKIKNISTSLVSLYAPNIHFNRELMPGREIPVSQEEYEELTFDHYLKITGIEEEKQVEVVENVFEATDIEKMLVNNDISAFMKFIVNATDAEKESTVNLAVEHKITNSGIVGLIKKYCGVDVIQAIAVKHDAEEK